MKCGFCGSELENGAQFCPNCGMIISLGDENDTANENGGYDNITAILVRI